MSTRETVWGSPPNWRSGIPAIAFAGIAGLLSLYAVWSVPRKVPVVYGSALEEQLQAYGQADRSDRESIEKIAGTINVAFSRLTSTTADNEDLLWRWAEFSREHADNLRSIASSGEVSDESLEQLEATIARYSSRASDNLEFLAAGESKYSSEAAVIVTYRKVSDVLAAGLVPPLGYADALTEHGDTGGDTSGRASAIVSYVLLENFQPESTLDVSGEQAPAAEQVRAQLDTASQDLPLAAAANLVLSAWESQDASAASNDDSSEESELSSQNYLSADAAWEEAVSNALVYIHDGDWNSLSFLLSRLEEPNVAIVRHVAARWISRLAESKLPGRSEQWLDRLPDGLQLAGQIAPESPHFATLMWRIGTTASEDEFPAAVDQLLLETVVGGRSPVIQHVALAISNCADGNLPTARSHVQLVQRATSSVDLFVSIVLGQMRSGAQEPELRVMLKLCEILVDVEPRPGIPLYAQAMVAYELGDLQLAAESMAEASEALPKNDNLLQLAKQFSNELEARGE